jgi:hypothetical protein
VAEALALALAAGCAAPSLGPATPRLFDVTAIPVGKAQAPWPPSTMTHRAILSIGGSGIPLDGRLAVGEKGELRLVALGAMGQVVFDILAEPGTAPRVLRSAAAVPEAWARDYAARDLDAVFRAGLSATSRIVGDGAGGYRLEAPDGTEIRYDTGERRGSGTPGPRIWSRIEGVRDGACVYRVSALEPHRFEGLDQPVPSRVRIEAVAYTLDIRIVELKPGPPPARLFRASAEGTSDEHR